MAWARQIAGPLARLLDRRDWLVLKIDTRDRERRMQTDPQTFFITPHYLNYPMMIVRIGVAVPHFEHCTNSENSRSSMFGERGFVRCSIALAANVPKQNSQKADSRCTVMGEIS